MRTLRLVSDDAIVQSRLNDVNWALAFARIEWLAAVCFIVIVVAVIQGASLP